MSLIARLSTAAIRHRPLHPRGVIPQNLVAAEFLPRCSACFINSSGQVALCDGGSANALFDGLVGGDVFPTDGVVRLCGHDTLVTYANNSLVIGQRVYLSGATAARPNVGMTHIGVPNPVVQVPLLPRVAAPAGSVSLNLSTGLLGHIPSGVTLHFTWSGGSLDVVLAGPAFTGDKILVVSATSADLPPAATATYSDATLYKGQLDTAPTTGDLQGMARVLDQSTIALLSPRWFG